MVKITKNIVNRTDRIYGHNNKRKFITIHETANPSRGADAERHGRLQQNGFSSSWHYTVDDKQAVQSFPHSAQCWHAGDGRGNGNLNSIGIEICVNSDGDFSKAVDNAAKLVKKIMKDENISIDNVVQHNHWSGKNCPANLRSGSKGISWNDFINKVKGSSGATTKKKTASKPKTKSSTTKTISVVDYLNAQGIDSSFSNRAKLARQHGINNYQGTASQNTQLLNKLRSGSKPKKQPKQSNKNVTSYTGSSLVDYLNLSGNSHLGGSSFSNRKRLASQHGISNYTGTASQNTRLLNALRGGSSSGSSSSSKSISQMATEVIRGDHGQGHAARQRSLGVDNATYKKVRAEVNRRL